MPSDNFLIRNRLDTKLTACLQDSLVIVEAAKGFGKSAFIASYLQRKNVASIWMPLSELDNTEPRFWRKFTSRVSHIDNILGSELYALGFPESIPLFDKVIGFIASAVNRQGRLVLVLDDFFFVTNQSVLDFFQLLIDAAIPDFSIIIISRRKPVLSVKKQTIGESHLSHKDLQFTEQEIEDYYFNLLKVVLPKTLITSILDYTYGCIAVIYLVGLSLKNQSKEAVYDISRLKLDVMQLINEYTFLRLSKKLQKLLVKVSLLEDFPYELLLILAGKNQDLIEELLLSNNFVIFDNFSGYIYIHHIFLEFLSSREYILTEKEITNTHQTAGDWYFSMGNYADAIGHYQKIDDYTKIMAVVRAFPNRSSSKLAGFGIQVIRKLPQASIDQHPQIALIYNKFLLNNFLLDESCRTSQQLIEKYEGLPVSEERQWILGEAYILLGFHSLFSSIENKQNKFIEYFKKADELMPKGSQMFDNTLHLTACGYINAVRDFSKGALESRLKVMMQAMPHVSSVMHGCGQGIIELMRAEKAFFMLDLNLADKYAHQAIFEANKSSQHDIKNMAHFYLMRISIMKGDFLNGQLQLLGISRKQISNDYCVAYDIYEGFFYLKMGQPEKLARWLKGDTADCLANSPITFSFDRLIRSKYYLLTQKYNELFAYLENREQYSMEDFFLGAIEIGVVKAIAYYQMGEKEKAISTLEKAYELALPNKILAPFVEAGKSMRTLANFLLNSRKTKIPAEWLEKISVKSSTYAKKLNKVVSAYQITQRMEQAPVINLSARELQVLNDVSLGLTREEIADDHNLSVNTIKNIMKSVFDKLGASNAYEAIRIAALKNLLK